MWHKTPEAKYLIDSKLETYTELKTINISCRYHAIERTSMSHVAAICYVLIIFNTFHESMNFQESMQIDIWKLLKYFQCKSLENDLPKWHTTVIRRNVLLSW